MQPAMRDSAGPQGGAVASPAGSIVPSLAGSAKPAKFRAFLEPRSDVGLCHPAKPMTKNAVASLRGSRYGGRLCKLHGADI